MLKKLFNQQKNESSSLIENPLFGPNHSYIPFVIYTHARSGSSLLVRLLASHPNVVCFGELFVNGRIGFGYDGFANDDQTLLEFRKSNPVKFLSEYVFTSYKSNVDAVGFKLFPEQVDSNFPAVKEWLAINRWLKIIVLNRSDYLAALASRKLAAETGKWGITDSSERNTATITLTVDECREFFKMRTSYFDASKDLFQGFDVLELDYTDLDNAQDETMTKAQHFLGIKPDKLGSSKVKQETRTLDKVIENYDELKKAFESSEFAHLF